MIAGSNVYNKKAGVLEVPGFVGPQIVDNHAAFDPPSEPVGGYDTQISHDVFEYNPNGSFKGYDASRCAKICQEWTQRNSEAPASDDGPFVDGAFAVCSMFVAYELRRTGKPAAMTCDTFSSVWSGHYQSVRVVDAMEISKVSAYQREDYQFPAICAIEEHCKGDEWYEGGDCSGWGREKCREPPRGNKNKPEDGPAGHNKGEEQDGNHDKGQGQGQH